MVLRWKRINRKCSPTKSSFRNGGPVSGIGIPEIEERCHNNTQNTRCGDKPSFVKLSYVRLRKSRHANICSKNQFFRENVVVIGFSELRPGSNERYENFTFYGPFRFLIFILILNKKTIL